MNKLELVTRELNNIGAFEGKPNSVAIKMVELLGESVPFPMSLAIANYTMATFTGHFHYKIELDTDNLIPMNVIIFILAKSGAKKTSSMLKLEKSLKAGYEVINKHRFDKARTFAEENDCNMPRINPLSNALATEAGMIKRLNDFKNEGIGLPSLYVDEISTELASNADMIPNIKLVAQLFDVGDMKSKPLKDSNNQSEEVVGMGMNALFIGSEHGILEDESVLRRFETEFISKLARRSIFVYPKFIETDEKVESIEELLNAVKAKKEIGYEVNNEINRISRNIAENSLENDFNNLKLSEDCANLYTLYSIYCEEITPSDVEAVALEQQHRHWKALKLAGVYAVFNGHAFVESKDLIEAIYVVELTGKDIGFFVEKANRLPYEIMLSHYQEGGEQLTVHDMVKRKWINRPSGVKDMLILANSKSGKKGMFERTEDDQIIYKSFMSSEGLGISLIKVSGTKEERSSKTAIGYEYKKTTFDKIGNVMCNDTAYCPFEFKGGIRGKDYIISSADFIVLDVDNSEYSDMECSDMLADYNHIIARTSSNSPYKFRVLLPLDVSVDIENDKWKPFMKKVSDHLGVEIDLLPKAQIYYGYAGRELIINKDGIDLEASELVKNIESVSPKVKQLKSNQLPDAWEDRMNLFSNAYNAKAGTGLHNNLWYATASAHDMGFSLEQGLKLLDDIVEYIEDKPRNGYVNTLKRRMITNTNTYRYWVAEAKELDGLVK
jgi:hypothetical protein